MDIRYDSACNSVGERIDGYEEPIALFTREAEDALRLVSDAGPRIPSPEHWMVALHPGEGA